VKILFFILPARQKSSLLGYSPFSDNAESAEGRTRSSRRGVGAVLLVARRVD
jgi:hypothetical protein